MVTKKTRSTSDDLRGASRLAIEAICGVTSLVEAMHRTIGGGPETLGRPLTTAAPGERLAGDGLVSVDSALGRHRVPALTLGFPAGNVWIGYGMNHRDLLSRADVYACIRDWLSSLDKTR